MQKNRKNTNRYNKTDFISVRDGKFLFNDFKRWLQV